jgi:integrase
MKGHASRTTKKIYMVMSKIFRDAVEIFEVIPKSPVRKHFHAQVIEDVERPSMTPLQTWAFLEYVMHHELYGVPIWIQCLAGLRVSEVQALEWRDIDFDENTITIRRAYNKLTKKIQNYPKNKRFATIPMAPALRKFLLPFKQKQGLVCFSSVGGMMSENGYDTFLNRICERLQLPIKSSHGLRHSCARLFIEMGAADEDVQRLLNHKTLASTKTYIHRTHEQLFKIAKKIA